MIKKPITVLSWDNALKLFPKKKADSEFCKLITKISQPLKRTNKNYVYRTQFEFGEKLIDKGTIFLDQFHVTSNDFSVTNGTFKIDLNYSDDPLGMILKNHIEIYSENKSISSKKGSIDNYAVPLNIIGEGELFGVFGALDYLIFCANNGKNISSKKTSRDWSAIAGNICFNIAFPFENDTDAEFIDDALRNKFLARQEDLVYPDEHKIIFAKEHIYNVGTATENPWLVDVIYFPKHFFDLQDHGLKQQLENWLLKVGWVQASPLRDALFENKVISDILYRTETRSLKHNKHFLNILYDYINKAGIGKAYVLKPLPSGHILNEAVINFKLKYPNYFTKSRHFEPLVFSYGKIMDKNDWGLLSIYHLPILLKYQIESLSVLFNDLNYLNNKIQGDSKHPHKSDYILPEIIAYGNTGGDSNSKAQKALQLKKSFLSPRFNIPVENINLTSKEFSNIILIKGK